MDRLGIFLCGGGGSGAHRDLARALRRASSDEHADEG